ncbi:hypothetical protein [Aestuariivirga sp.]|uniref:hypothetical protein n=1 Tax=Aestuariivirga sp. TaxID=2650926 RepID=UPI0025BEFFFB|nr:hypothetical protein [Aestuariivirga sp.]MCA3556433.1 hypothetical protein [Aestuariivirga sp.]
MAESQKASEIRERGRAWRDTMLQMTATIMIPLTIAGMGLYYTRWQQNVNDLKTMIDLVSDDKPERQKYGIAMFEYLLKNDKVPVEFVAAQLDYANNASDPQLLPAMERALTKAAQSNANVQAVFKEAVERLPSRVFVNVLNEQQRACFSKLLTGLKDNDGAAITVPSITMAKWDGKVNEIRAMNDDDVPKAEAIAEWLRNMGFDIQVVNLTNIWAGARKVRPNTFEIWFGDKDLPSMCTGKDVTLASPPPSN